MQNQKVPKGEEERGFKGEEEEKEEGGEEDARQVRTGSHHREGGA